LLAVKAILVSKQGPTSINSHFVLLYGNLLPSAACSIYLDVLKSSFIVD